MRTLFVMSFSLRRHFFFLLSPVSLDQLHISLRIPWVSSEIPHLSLAYSGLLTRQGQMMAFPTLQRFP